MLCRASLVIGVMTLHALCLFNDGVQQQTVCLWLPGNRVHKQTGVM